MGIRQTFREALDQVHREIRIAEDGHPWQLVLTAQPFEPDQYTSGELSAMARDSYAEEKARRDPLDVDPFS